ncbi:GNAT family N-acetyltransferase [Actinophytocola gossypii]|uniref:GNAT family N-acetyltransferase n=1 Tax=Actinophytocola gossypii TaxID=2812003 RepID=A0ABT2JJ04_9PSEU|nr:GNAT family N-acetyltransferase [Actinophytocola gossypii]MCT2587733.1 GNAT family N-acetyltransferase [Actinophytocola gossypii]
MDVFLATDRLLLRRFADGDADYLVELDSDPEVMRYLNGGRPTARSHIERSVLPTILGEYERDPDLGVFAAFAKKDGSVDSAVDSAFVGWFMLRRDEAGPRDEAELGYRLRRAAWGRGYATEGSRVLLHHAFATIGLRRVHAETMAVNAGSRRVMEKLGLRYETTYFPPFAPIPGSEHGEVRYGLDRETWNTANERKNLHGLS